MKNIKHELQEVVSVTNFKGGVGKTTTVQNISACLLRLNPNLRVLVIDLDQQCNLSDFMGWGSYLLTHKEKECRTIYDAMCNGSSLPVYKNNRGVYYVPGSSKMQGIDAYLGKQMQPKMVLAKCFRQPIDNHTEDNLDKVVNSFDYVFIDCPPALSDSTYNAMGVASGLLIPLQMEEYSLSALTAILTEADKVKEDLNEGLEILGLLPVMVDNRPNFTKAALTHLENGYKDLLLKARVRRSIKLNEAQNEKLDIFSYAPTCTVAQDYEAATKELFKL